LDSNIAHRTSDFEFFSKLLGKLEALGKGAELARKRFA